jgi:hypothetical protein
MALVGIAISAIARIAVIVFFILRFLVIGLFLLQTFDILRVPEFSQFCRYEMGITKLHAFR